MQFIATHYNTLQHTAAQVLLAEEHRELEQGRLWPLFKQCTRAATHNSTMQHTVTHCNTLQYTSTFCNTLQHTATQVSLAHEHLGLEQGRLWPLLTHTITVDALARIRYLKDHRIS